jgi:hypothetical protein
MLVSIVTDRPLALFTATRTGHPAIDTFTCCPLCSSSFGEVPQALVLLLNVVLSYRAYCALRLSGWKLFVSNTIALPVS